MNLKKTLFCALMASFSMLNLFAKDKHHESFAGIYNIQVIDGVVWNGVLTLNEGGTGSLYYTSSDPADARIPEAYYWRQTGKHTIELKGISVACIGDVCFRSAGPIPVSFDKCNRSGQGRGSARTYSLDDLKLQNPTSEPFGFTLIVEKITQ